MRRSSAAWASTAPARVAVRVSMRWAISARPPRPTETHTAWAATGSENASIGQITQK